MEKENTLLGKCPTCGEDRTDKYIPFCRKCYKEYVKKQRNELIDEMGGFCIRCGQKDKRALQIDHVRGDGHNDRKQNVSSGLGYLKRVRESIQNDEGKFQLLCASCNWIKRHENNEVSHGLKKETIEKKKATKEKNDLLFRIKSSPSSFSLIEREELGLLRFLSEGEIKYLKSREKRTMSDKKRNAGKKIYYTWYGSFGKIRAYRICDENGGEGKQEYDTETGEKISWDEIYRKSQQKNPTILKHEKRNT